MTDQQQATATAARVRTWLACHAGELTAVTAPSAAALTVSPWAWLATAVAGGLWARHELRHTRTRRALASASAGTTAEPDQHQLEPESAPEVDHG